MAGGLGSVSFALLVDLVVAGLLLATIVFAVVLNRRLDALRGARAEFERLLRDFSAATERAERGIAELREAAGAAGETLGQRIETGTGLADDLMFLIERGTGLAERLEQPGRRDAGAGEAASGPAVEVEPALQPSPEQESLMASLRGVR